MKNKLFSLLILISFCSQQNLFSQCISMPPASAFTINGSAASLGNNEYRLTENMGSQSGSLWFGNYLNLDYDFSLEFEVYLGSNMNGADGITFVLQQSPQGTAATSPGGGLGYKGISPSLDIEYDTWQNSDYSDPYDDHIAINKNGSVEHTGAQVASPVTVFNMEDGRYHKTKITWQASSRFLRVYWDTDTRPKIEKVVDMKTSIFNNNPFVYWGWTGSTGYEKNLQKIKLVNVSFRQVLEVTANVSPSNCGTPTGRVDVSISGGVAPFSYSWSTGEKTEDISNLNPGRYTVTVTDACGNTGTQTHSVSTLSMKPVIKCPSNIVLDNTPGKCGTDNVIYALPLLEGNCPGTTISQTEGLSSGATFNMGTTTNTFIARTTDGLSSTCSFTVTVR